MNEFTPVPKAANPFGETRAITQPITALASVEQQRAIAEVQAQMTVARALPRDPVKCMDALINDCMIVSLAEDAAYQYARGGTDISGPSIKLAEAAARRWGNIRSGFREISRANGMSDVVVEAWDLESGYYDFRQFQVKHWRDTKKGGYQLTDERDIYEVIANNAQRRKRAVLLSVIPPHVIEAALTQCELTLKAKADTTPEGLKKLVDAFATFGVSQQQIEQRIQRRLEAITPAQVVGLKRVYASLRDGMSVPGDWFDPIETNAVGPTPTPTPSPTPSPAGPGAEGQAAAQESKPAAPSGKAAAMRQKVKDKAGVAQTEEQPQQSTATSGAGGGGDAGSTPAAGAQSSIDQQAMELLFVDWKSALEGADSPEALADVLARAEQSTLTLELKAELRKLADQAGG